MEGQLLEYLLVEKFPHQIIVPVLDNAVYHRNRVTLAALSSFKPRVRVFWLTNYCPNLNLIERFWRHLKDLAFANRLYVGGKTWRRKCSQEVLTLVAGMSCLLINLVT